MSTPHSFSTSTPKVAIAGRAADTGNYERALSLMGITAITTMHLGQLNDYDALLLPGGGDITPAFFGQHNKGSRNIDVELDIFQLQALDLFVKCQKPVLGICKGIQIINVYFGGTIIQDLPEAEHHAWNGADRYHSSLTEPDSFLNTLYGRQFMINSAHHQGIDETGRDLSVQQRSDDGIIEALRHDVLPVLGVQWHPERLFDPYTPKQAVNGRPLFSYFLSLCNPTIS